MIVTSTEVKESASGTRFTKVKCYDPDSNLCAIDYIPFDNNPDYDSGVEDCQSVSPGYLTDTSNIKRK